MSEKDKQERLMELYDTDKSKEKVIEDSKNTLLRLMVHYNKYLKDGLSRSVEMKEDCVHDDLALAFAQVVQAYVSLAIATK